LLRWFAICIEHTISHRTPVVIGLPLCESLFINDGWL
jgi:hypothetical protein